MRLLLDTNIILRLAKEDAPEHQLVSKAVEQLIVSADEIVLVPQCIYEFWSTGTRPVVVNGFGWTPQRTRLEVEKLLLVFHLLPDTPDIFSHWLELVTTHHVAGKQIHDARLAAALKAHGLGALLTLNGDDFRRFGTEIIHPREVLA